MLDDREFGVHIPIGSTILSSQSGPHRLWTAPNLLYNGNRELFLQEKRVKW
jgi:hypothetical protein